MFSAVTVYSLYNINIDSNASGCRALLLAFNVYQYLKQSSSGKLDHVAQQQGRSSAIYGCATCGKEIKIRGSL
jgi:hypothetical protein